MSVNREFSIYRPAKKTGKLEGIHHEFPSGMWKPSISYKNTLKDIRRQFTPAESYRYQLATSGKEIRLLQKLETRWNHQFDLFTDASSKIQAAYRGMMSRRHFYAIKDELTIQLRQRQGHYKACIAFQANDYQKALDIILGVPYPTKEILIIKFKTLYAIRDFQRCIAATMPVLDMDETNEEALFLQLSSYAQLSAYDKAYDSLKKLTAMVNQPAIEVYKMNAYLCCKLNPPLFLEAVDSLNYVVQHYPADCEAIMQRACCYAATQDWNMTIEDLNHILVFKPDFAKARLLRARAFCCCREWKKAKEDYRLIISKYNNEKALVKIALDALKSIDHEYVELPMMDALIVKNES